MDVRKQLQSIKQIDVLLAVGQVQKTAESLLLVKIVMEVVEFVSNKIHFSALLSARLAVQSVTELAK